MTPTDTGTRFGLLTVVERHGKYKNGETTWLCRCDCGTERVVINGNLRKGNTTSCGCVGRAKGAARMSTLNLRHGRTRTRLHKIWTGIVDRTTNPNSHAFQRYGGRGIGLCSEWMLFEAFAAAVGEPPTSGHTIDRIDNDRGYEPGNVRWALPAEQARNRSTNVRVRLPDGREVIASDAAEMLGVSKSTVSRWVAAGRLARIDVPHEVTG